MRVKRNRVKQSQRLPLQEVVAGSHLASHVLTGSQILHTSNDLYNVDPPSDIYLAL